jgi:ribosomal protein S18 acetylase RimI-like enzyme
MKLLTIDQLEHIEPLVTRYENAIKETVQFPKSLIDLIKEWLESEKVRIGYTENTTGTPTGAAVIIPHQDRVLALFTDHDGMEEESICNTEEVLLDWCFAELKNHPVRFEIPGMTDSIKRALLQRGYKEYERAQMIVMRENFSKHSRIQLPEGYSLETYDSEKKSQIAEVLASANKGHVDAIIYPEYFSSAEKGMEFLVKLEKDAFGEFSPDASKILKHENRIIGYCLISIEDDAALIPDIAIDPEYQGKGLGKALLTNTLIDTIESNDSVKGIGLAVTLSNPAKFLYEKLGFAIRKRFSSIVYSK